MEIREFAGRVLFSGALEDKLAPATDLSDESPGPAQAAPTAPGRPADLALRPPGERPAFPRDPHLIDEEQRGLLLHFFCNHELLATELMALVLLKFPEAPAEFRRGIVRTLHEEQLHTRWYLERMRECGVRFGDFPVNGFFWENVAPMATPLDYVTRLSLTFEQANLDYARHYSRVLREVGDASSAALLGRIYRDEIGHVGYGLEWFRRWKPAGTTDWEAYRAGLVFPLSPSRGKGGVAFNREGRRRAGLSEDFVREMEVFEQSRGRTPNVFWFNPHAEAEVASERSGRRFQPRRRGADLASDLGVLAGFLGHRDDLLLLDHPLPTAERERLRAAGLLLPQVEVRDAHGGLPAAVRERKLNEVRPWAWAPDAARLFRGLRSDAVMAELFSKTLALELREKLGLSFGRVIRSVEELPREGGVVMKAPWGTSGQKNRRWRAGEPLPPACRTWAERTIEAQGALVVEPRVERVCDFAVQYEMTAEGLRKVAMTHLENDARGQFVAASFGWKFGVGLSAEVARFLMEERDGRTRLAIFDEEIPGVLEPRLRGFRGALGVDALVYREGGELALMPLLEINPRFTMGRLAFALSRAVSPGRTVRLELVNRSRAVQSGCESLGQFAETLAVPELDKNGLMQGGAFALNDPMRAKQVLAVLQVG